MKNMKMTTKIIIIVSAIVVAAAIALLALLTFNGRIYNGISVGGVDLGGKTTEEAMQLLQSKDFYTKLPEFVCEGRRFTVASDDIDLECDAEKTVSTAHAYGRDENIFNRIGNIFNVMFNPVDLPIEIKWDDKKLDAVFEEHIGDMRTPSVEPQIRLEGDKLYITNGSEGLDVSRDKFRKDVVSAATEKPDSIELVIETVNPTLLSAEKLYEQYAKKPVNAEYSISNMRISYTESADGIDFDVSEAEAILKDNLKNSKEYFIPVIVVAPEMTLEELDKSMFGDCLGTYTTKYNPGEVGRTKNVSLAARNINNVVLKQGDVFSYNALVGERTEARGFAGAKVYAGGEVVDGLGGGICQVSSTLYNAVLYADLEIVSRTAHSLPVAYVSLGRDATVSYGSIDFKFKNQYADPVKITAHASGGILTVSVHGKKTSDKQVEIWTEWVSSTPFSVREEEDETIAEGQTKVKQTGSNGAVVNTYKKVVEDGKVVSSKFIHKSVYSPIHKIVLVPPKPEEVLPEGEIAEELPDAEGDIAEGVGDEMAEEATAEVPVSDTPSETDITSDEAAQNVQPTAEETVTEGTATMESTTNELVQ
ncbi:MAG: hypothetical protein E7416_00495 [Ruminococcaceae bacterium]|nr:hypothetical protein [Oscillospiraceae bacterium]